MTAYIVSQPIPTIPDIDGQPLDRGEIYIGQPGSDPIPLANRKTAYWDAALTQVATQPISTIGGYPSNNGARSRLYVDGDYSIAAVNSKGSILYTATTATDFAGRIVGPSATSAGNLPTWGDASGRSLTAGYAPSALPVTATDTTAPRSLGNRFADVVNVRDFGAVGDGVADDRAAFVAACAVGGRIHVPAGQYRIGAVGEAEAAVSLAVAGTSLELDAGAVLLIAGTATNSVGVRLCANNTSLIGGEVRAASFNQALWGTDNVNSARLTTKLVQVRPTTASGPISSITVDTRLRNSNGTGLQIFSHEDGGGDLKDVTVKLDCKDVFEGVALRGASPTSSYWIDGVKFLPGTVFWNSAGPNPTALNASAVLGANCIRTDGGIRNVDFSGVWVVSSGRMAVEIYSSGEEKTLGLVATNISFNDCDIGPSQYRTLSFAAFGLRYIGGSITGYTAGGYAWDFIEIAGKDLLFFGVSCVATGIPIVIPDNVYIGENLTIENATFVDCPNAGQDIRLEATGWKNVVFRNIRWVISNAMAAGQPNRSAVIVIGCVNAVVDNVTVTMSGGADRLHGIEAHELVGSRVVNSTVELIGLPNNRINSPWNIAALGQCEVAGNRTVSSNGATFSGPWPVYHPLGGVQTFYRWAYSGGAWTKTLCNANIRNGPPGTPTNGLVYVLSDNPTGAWAANPRSFAVTNDGGATWAFTPIADVIFYSPNTLYRAQLNEDRFPRYNTSRAYLLTSVGLMDVVWSRNDFTARNTLVGSNAQTGLNLSAYGVTTSVLYNLYYQDNVDTLTIGTGSALGAYIYQPTGAITGSIGSVVTPLTGVYSNLLQVAAGSAAAPSMSFMTDQDTGFYSWGANTVGVALGGLERLLFSASGVTLVDGSGATSLSHQLINSAGSIGINLQADGTFRFLNNSTGQNAWKINTGTGGDGSHEFVTNGGIQFIVDNVTGSARRVKVGGSASGNPYVGTDTGSLDLKPNGLTALSLRADAGAVNYGEFRAAATTGSPGFFAMGPDTNIGLSWVTKGTGVTAFYSHGGSAIQCVIGAVAGANRWPVISGSNGGNPSIAASGGAMQFGGSVILGASGANVGFFGSAGGVKPTWTGSRGGNAALASLLTSLAALGLGTDSTTA